MDELGDLRAKAQLGSPAPGLTYAFSIRAGERLLTEKAGSVSRSARPLD